MVFLFAGLILSLTAGVVYVLNQALHPRTPAALAVAAENLCTARHEPASRAWRECLRFEPRPPAEGAVSFLLGGTGAALLGLALVVLAARGRRSTFIPAALLGIVVTAGTAYAIRARDRDVRLLERTRTASVQSSPQPTQPILSR
jgi:hypothetical protein